MLMASGRASRGLSGPSSSCSGDSGTRSSPAAITNPPSVNPLKAEVSTGYTLPSNSNVHF